MVRYGCCAHLLGDLCRPILRLHLVAPGFASGRLGATVRWGVLVRDVVERKCGPARQRAVGSGRRGDAQGRGRRAGLRAETRRSRCADADAIRDPEVDAVYVATWPNTRATCRAVRGVWQAGLCREAVGPRAIRGRRAVAAAERAGVGLWVSYYRRAHPLFERVREIVTSGAIGPVRYVQVRLQRPVQLASNGGIPWRLRPEVSGGGRFVDLGCHMLDWLDHALGPLQCIESQAYSREEGYTAEDEVRASFRTAQGVQVDGHWWFCGPPDVWHDRTTIEGERGSVEFPFFVPGPIVVDIDGVRSEEHIASPNPITMPFVQSVVDQMLGHADCASTAVSALRTDVLIDEILRSGGLR